MSANFKLEKKNEWVQTARKGSKDHTAFQIPDVHMFGVVGILYCRSRLKS